MAEIKKEEDFDRNGTSTVEISKLLFIRKSSGNGKTYERWSSNGPYRFNEYMTNIIQFNKDKALVGMYNKVLTKAQDKRKYLNR